MIKLIIIFLIKVYQKTWSLVTPKSCRFYPSCSEYTVQAVEAYGVVKGSLWGIKRILKCHPFHPGGIDFLGEPYEYSHYK
jgi:putative membrane protein insertion efficiency factor